MRERDEFPVKNGVFPKPAHADAHAAPDVAVEPGLRTVFLFEIRDERLWRRWQVEAGKRIFESLYGSEYLFTGRFLLERDIHCGHVAVGNRHADAIYRYMRCLGKHEGTILYRAPNFHRLFLRFFFFGRNVG